MPVTMCIMRPFSEEKKEVEWVSVECIGGSFMVGQGHRPLVNVLAGGKMITYKEGGHEETVEVSAEGGLVHVAENKVLLFLS